MQLVSGRHVIVERSCISCGSKTCRCRTDLGLAHGAANRCHTYTLYDTHPVVIENGFSIRGNMTLILHAQGCHNDIICLAYLHKKWVIHQKTSSADISKGIFWSISKALPVQLFNHSYQNNFVHLS